MAFHQVRPIHGQMLPIKRKTPNQMKDVREPAQPRCCEVPVAMGRQEGQSPSRCAAGLCYRSLWQQARRETTAIKYQYKLAFLGFVCSLGTFSLAVHLPINLPNPTPLWYCKNLPCHPSHNIFHCLLAKKLHNLCTWAPGWEEQKKEVWSWQSDAKRTSSINKNKLESFP